MKVARGQKQPDKAPKPRGSPFVRTVHEAVIAQLAAVGFERLSIPDVAVQAGVNKTSIYRRWPTKADLVRAALEAFMGSGGTPVSTGELRSDLIATAGRAAAFVQSQLGTAALRMLLAEGANPEVRGLAASMLRRQEADGPRELFDLAISQGELPPDADVPLILSTVAGALMHRAFIEHKQLTDTYIQRLVDLILHGAGGTGAKVRLRSPRRPR
jgi:AcrR family transcriptional regulator